MKTGRNDPCPCGSGDKYKKCCLGAPAPASEVPADITPAELVQRRCRAFGERDFALIYDTYHPESYFLRQFPDRRAYIDHGRRNLSSDFQIRECRILKEESAEGEARVIFYLDTLYRGEPAKSFELSRFLMTEGGWRYHSSQKLERAAFAGEVSDIDWDDFDKVKDKVFF